METPLSCPGLSQQSQSRFPPFGTSPARRDAQSTLPSSLPPRPVQVTNPQKYSWQVSTRQSVMDKCVRTPRHDAGQLPTAITAVSASLSIRGIPAGSSTRDSCCGTGGDSVCRVTGFVLCSVDSPTPGHFSPAHCVLLPASPCAAVPKKQRFPVCPLPG